MGCVPRQTSRGLGWRDSCRCRRAPAPHRAAAVDFLLEGLYAQKKISRSDQFQYVGSEQPRRATRAAQSDPRLEHDLPMTGNKKKYYN